MLPTGILLASRLDIRGWLHENVMPRATNDLTESASANCYAGSTCHWGPFTRRRSVQRCTPHRQSRHSTREPWPIPSDPPKTQGQIATAARHGLIRHYAHSRPLATAAQPWPSTRCSLDAHHRIGCSTRPDRFMRLTLRTRTYRHRL